MKGYPSAEGYRGAGSSDKEEQIRRVARARESIRHVRRRDEGFALTAACVTERARSIGFEGNSRHSEREISRDLSDRPRLRGAWLAADLANLLESYKTRSGSAFVSPAADPGANFAPFTASRATSRLIESDIRCRALERTSPPPSPSPRGSNDSRSRSGSTDRHDSRFIF